MAESVVVCEVEILAIHVGCHARGDIQRIERPANETDAFTRRVLEPLAAWWTAHRMPEVGMVEVLLANGEYAEWENTIRGVDD